MEKKSIYIEDALTNFFFIIYYQIFPLNIFPILPNISDIPEKSKKKKSCICNCLVYISVCVCHVHRYLVTLKIPYSN